MDIARDFTLDASREGNFNPEMYTYLLMGMNHVVRHQSEMEKAHYEEDKAQSIALVMTLMYKYRKLGSPTNDFYIQMINFLQFYREFDKIDIVLQNMNKDKIVFDGRVYVEWSFINYYFHYYFHYYLDMLLSLMRLRTPKWWLIFTMMLKTM